jgi:hypothetical protein
MGTIFDSPRVAVGPYTVISTAPMEAIRNYNVLKK